MKEIWKDIVGYEGLYQINNYGMVKALDHYVQQKNRWGQSMIRIQKSRLMKTQVSKNEYVRLT